MTMETNEKSYLDLIRESGEVSTKFVDEEPEYTAYRDEKENEADGKE